MVLYPYSGKIYRQFITWSEGITLYGCGQNAKRNITPRLNNLGVQVLEIQDRAAKKETSVYSGIPYKVAHNNANKLTAIMFTIGDAGIFSTVEYKLREWGVCYFLGANKPCML